MPIFEVEKDGASFEVDAPDQKTALEAFARYQPVPDVPEPAAPSTLGDVASSFGRGVAKGAIGLAGLPGDVGRLVGRGVHAAGSALGLPEPPPEALELPGMPPSSAQLTRGVEAVAGKFGEPQTVPGQYAQSIGEVAASAPLQPGGLLTKAATTIAGGVGAKAGGKLAAEFDLPEGLGELIGGTVGGGVAGTIAAGRTAARARALLPTSEANRRASRAAFDQIGQAGLVIEPTEVGNFVARVRADLSGPRGLFTAHSAPRAYQAADQIERAGGDLATILDVHSTLGTVAPGDANYAAAMLVRDRVREWVANLQPNQIIRGDPGFISAVWQHARETWRVHSNLEEIYGALESAEWRRLSSGRGTNLNTLRQNIRRILDNDRLVRRYSPQAQEAMSEVVEGDLARNTMRRLAAYAPHGPVSSIPAVLSLVTGHADFGTAIAAGGFLAHFLQGRMEQRSLDALLDIIREGSPLTTPRARAMTARARQPIAGVSAARGAILGAGAESPLAEPPEPVAEPGP